MKIKKLNLGSGNLLFKNWINLDIKKLSSNHNMQYIQHDLIKGIPFDTDGVDIIYSSHFLEHLDPFNDTISFLNECKRVLKENGILIISVPDFKKIAQIYLSSPRIFYEEYNYHKNWFDKASSWSRRLGISTMYEHKMLYDLESLAEVLNIAGFKNLEVLNEKYFKDNMKDIILTHTSHSLIVKVSA